MPRRRPKTKPSPAGKKPADGDGTPEPLRIIGGRYRGSKLSYEPLTHDGATVTRPMKHRVREAIFNLIGMRAEGKHAIDLFAGTGALALEALSRGAKRATLIERHIPTAEIVRANVEALGVEEVCEVKTTNAFLWIKRDLPAFATELPWLVFVSPPYSFFVERHDEMLGMINTLADAAPAGSLLVVESDERFDFAPLPGGVRLERGDPGWDVRTYAPAVVGVLEVEPA
ncbi:Ribosomal RNA small subunit methyltransferase D [Posidoniimonas polymericola]|uniref:Ribosomal RNA small subunit methyltransferase D n=1 Tax=Posidoniimonas polymericola TaxID=2528002 RepID=A0A5C5YH41_9BACT|nr:RsmD family RNA methyltransferase [Posidoniimonas polymericola]TWT74429.1 Ribosomal RNA small subunit methyltransferase D [Posidoniimonas polymericola]